MSKVTLKKELLNLEHHQLIDLLLDLYQARKEAKEYLDFFVNPDVNKELQRAQKAIIKELQRTKRGHCKARITKIKSIIKNFESLNTGFENDLTLRLFVIEEGLKYERNLYFPNTLLNGISHLARQTLLLGDSNMAFTDTLEQLNNLVNNEKIGTSHFRHIIRSALSA